MARRAGLLRNRLNERTLLSWVQTNESLRTADSSSPVIAVMQPAHALLANHCTVFQRACPTSRRLLVQTEVGSVVVIIGNVKPQLLQLAEKAKTVDGYVIQVKGYASAVGSAALNQKLSTERADHVTDFMEQQGHVPLTNILAPGAMGTSRQVAPDTTTEGQADNRRVVVRILQNKGIAGN